MSDRFCTLFDCCRGRNRVVTHRSMIELTLYLFLPMPIYTLLGFIPGLPFMKRKFEIYIFGAWFGFLLGPIWSFSRCLFVDLIPKEQEARFFALYAITDKGSSWIGPLLVGLIANLGTMRYGMIVVLCTIVIGLVILRKVDVNAGIQQVKQFESEGKDNNKELHNENLNGKSIEMT